MKIKKLRDTAIILTHPYSGDAGLDLYSDAQIPINVGQTALVSTGIAVELPPDHFGLIMPRSGLSTERGILLCSSGIIDSGYRGEIIVGLINLGTHPYIIFPKERVAQLIIIPFYSPALEIVEKLSDSGRGDKGHGSSGK